MLTFVIPAYGESPYLEDCILSLRAQKLICPIIIATSTPNPLIKGIAKKYDIELFVNTSKTSIASDWNFALTCAKSKLVVLAHQDDLYHSHFSIMVTDFITKFPQCAIAFTDSKEMINDAVYDFTKREFIKRILRKIAFLRGAVISSANQYFRLLGFGCPIPCSSVVFNLSNLKGLYFSEKYSVNLDWDFWTRVAIGLKPIGYIRGSLLTHRIHRDAETQIAIKELRRKNEDNEIFSRYWPKFIVPMLYFFYKFGY